MDSGLKIIKKGSRIKEQFYHNFNSLNLYYDMLMRCNRTFFVDNKIVLSNITV